MSSPSVIARPRAASRPRKLSQVPFVELFGGRVQGIVSSGSDWERVYCSFIDNNGDYYCSTNNNRRCGGLGGPCKHIGQMVDQAILAYGAADVAACLKIDLAAAGSSRAVFGARRGSEKKEPAGVVFARFLGDLHYVELPAGDEPMPELAWFLVG